jgi:[NiFe] hydrogenase assembly HybE family chaperone
MLNDRIELLERSFRHIASTRMAGVPVLHSALQVRAVGFAPLPEAPDWALGVLVTPWFINLLRLPLQPLADVAGAAAAGCLDVGRDAKREIGGQPLHFVGAHEDRLGHYEQCSLFSPMFHFADQAAAVATAAEVMKLLRNPQPTSSADSAGTADTAPQQKDRMPPVASEGAVPRPATDGQRPASPAQPPLPPVLEARPGRRGFLLGRGPAGGSGR